MPFDSGEPISVMMQKLGRRGALVKGNGTNGAETNNREPVDFVPGQKRGVLFICFHFRCFRGLGIEDRFQKMENRSVLMPEKTNMFACFHDDSRFTELLV